MSNAILQPVVALVLWSMAMWAWLYATRIPAIVRSKVEMAPSMTTADLNQHLPPQVRWKADNYNHLMEQPTLFYATALTLALLGQGDGFGRAAGAGGARRHGRVLTAPNSGARLDAPG